MEKSTLDLIKENKIIAIIRGIPSDMIVDTAKALVEGGIHMMEVTFDHSGPEGINETLRSISLLKEQMQGMIHVGAGTVLTLEEVDAAWKCGAEYMISPNVDEKVIRRTKELGLVSMPGAFTPSEIVDAYNYGGDIIKMFPAGLLGVSYMKAVLGPLSHIPLAAVGGVTPENLHEFMNIGVNCFGIGGNLVNRSLVSSRDFKGITERGKAFREAALN